MRILQLNTYPIHQPRNGGQRRIAAMHAAYRTAGIDARFAAIFYPAHYPPGSFTEDDIVIGPTVRAAIHERPCLEDVVIGARFVDTPLGAGPTLRCTLPRYGGLGDPSSQETGEYQVLSRLPPIQIMA